MSISLTSVYCRWYCECMSISLASVYCRWYCVFMIILLKILNRSLGGGGHETSTPAQDPIDESCEGNYCVGFISLSEELKFTGANRRCQVIGSGAILNICFCFQIIFTMLIIRWSILMLAMMMFMIMVQFNPDKKTV
jgi:hypothetical protein